MTSMPRQRDTLSVEFVRHEPEERPSRRTPEPRHCPLLHQARSTLTRGGRQIPCTCNVDYKRDSILSIR